MPRTARPLERASRRVHLDRGQRRVLARRREEPAAHPHLRDRVGHAGGPRRLPAAHGGSRAPRPPQARRRPRPVLVPRGDRLGPGRLPSARRARADDHGGLLAAAPRGGRLPVRVLAPHHEARAVRHERAPRVVRGRHVPADGARRRHRVLPEADELPVPRADLQGADALLPRAAAAAVRVRRRLPLREVRRGARPDPRARHDAGRRAHLHDEASRWGRSCARCSTSRCPCCATTASTTSTWSCRRSPRRRRSGPTRSGTRRPRRCARRPSARISSS